MKSIRPAQLTKIVDDIRRGIDVSREMHPEDCELGGLTKEDLAKKYKVKTSHIEQALRVLNREGYVGHAVHSDHRWCYGWTPDHYRILGAKPVREASEEAWRNSVVNS